MVVSLLSTKYSIPPAGINRVVRHHLLQKLDDGLRQEKRLILVCAPAGYGKTSLISDWVNRIVSGVSSTISDTTAVKYPVRVAWLTCEQEDGDLARFLAYLVASLQKVNPRIGKGLLATFHASKLPKPSTLMTLLINDLAEIEEHLVLVLDDFHTISSQPVHDLVAYMVEHQPPSLSLVLATRADPSLPLPKLRARGQLVEIRQNELSFTPDESTEFMRRIMQVEITQDQLHALEKRTEGWAAGLQLAALSLRSVRDVAAFIETFSGGHEYIADYLTDEVLARQPEDTQSFLLQTSILEQLSAPLCAVVTGNVHAGEVLETLREQNLFLIALDQEKVWCRYHTLFSDLLRNRLMQQYTSQVDGLRLRASQWYEDDDHLEPAIEYALEAKSFDRAAQLIVGAVEAVFINGQVDTLSRWLDLLPDEVKDRHALLWLFQGLALSWRGFSPAPVLTSLTNLKNDIHQDGLTGKYETLQALNAMTDGKTTQASTLAHAALQKLSPRDHLFRCLATDVLGMVNTLDCEIPQAIQAFQQTAQISSRAGYAMFEITALSHLAGLHLQQGKLRASTKEYQQVLSLATSKLGKRSPVTATVLLGLGEIYREWNEQEKALRLFLESVELFTQFSEIGLPISYLSIARLKASQGDWDAAHEYIEKARQVARESKVTRLNDQLVAALEAHFQIKRGELKQAEQWAREAGLVEHPISEILKTAGIRMAGSEFIHSDYINLARLYLAQNKAEAALEVINPLLDVAISLGYVRREIQILVLKALALQQQKATERAVEVIKEALALAEPEGYLQTFLEDASIAPLLYRAIEKGSSPAYAKKLLAALKQTDLLNDTLLEKKKMDKSLVEPLSTRELEVLDLLHEGLSNREIALRLHISLSTVKGHTANIFGKLGVNSRARAVSEAVRLGLLQRRSNS